MNIRRFLLFLISIGYQLFSISHINAQSTASSPFSASYITTENGLVSIGTNAIFQDHNGFIWVGTSEGLVRYDGVNFDYFNNIAKNQTFSTRFTQALQTSEGAILAISEQGHLVHLAEDTLRLVLPNDTYSEAFVHSVKDAGNNLIYLSTRDGMFTYDLGNEVITPFAHNVFNGEIISFEILSKGRIAFANPSAKQIFITDGVNTISNRTIYERKVWFTAHTHVGDKDIVSFENESFIVEGNVIKAIPPKDFQANSGNNALFYFDNKLYTSVTSVGLFVSDSLLDPFPKKLITYKEGAYRNPFHTYKSKLLIHDTYNIYLDGVPIFTSNTNIREVLVDIENTIWAVTAGEGIIRLTEKKAQTYSIEHGLRFQNLYSVDKGPQNSLLVGSYRAGLDLFSQGKFSPFYPKSLEKTIYTQTASMLSNGEILLGASSLPLWVIQPNKNNVYTHTSYPIESAMSIFEDSKKRVWIGSSNGLWVKNSFQNWSDAILVPTPSNSVVRVIRESPTGKMIFGTNGDGFWIYDGFNFREISASDGMPSNFVRDIKIESESRDSLKLWVVTENSGLVWVELSKKDVRSVSINRDHGLHHNYIHNLSIDSKDRFWFGSNNGIFWVDVNELRRFIKGEENRIHSFVLTKQDGLLNNEMNGGSQHSVYMDENEILWYPSQNGLVRIDTRDYQQNRVIPTTNVRLVEFGEAKLPSISRDIDLGKSQRDITFYFTNSSLTSPEKNLFQHKLVPIESEWSVPTTNRKVSYRRLSPGTYTMMARSSNNDGIWDEKGIELVFTIKPYFRETKLYYFLWVLVGIIIVGTAFFLRFRISKLNEERLQRQVRIKTKALEVEKERSEEQRKKIEQFDHAKSELLAGISHEMRTPLTLILNPVKELASHRLVVSDKKLSQLSHILVNNSNRIKGLIENLLDLSQIKSQTIALRKDSFDLVVLVREILTALSLEMKHKGIHVNLIFDSSELVIHADEIRVRSSIYQILNYLVSKISSGNFITLQTQVNDDNFHLNIMAHGVELPTEVKDRLTLGQGGNQDSNGLSSEGIGLSLINLYTKAHGGSIAVETLNIGDKIILKFPSSLLVRDSIIPSKKATPIQENLVYKEEKETKQDGTVPTNQERILVVDDNPEMRLLVKYSLRRNYFITEAADGLEGWNILTRQKIDLVISDMIMPNMNGMELLRKIRAEKRTQDIPVILLSARNDEETLIESINSGADQYLVKPTSKEMLIAQVHRLLSTSRTAPEIVKEKQESKKEESYSDIQPDFLDLLNQVIKFHFHDSKFGVESLSDKMKIERSYLFRRCKQELSISPSELIMQYRLNAAKQMLENGSYSMAEISDSCGFSSPSYFSQSFKSQTGQTPREYISQSVS